ncbi:MAG: hypothetical protein ACI9SQ_000886 [Rubritalea sp.]
MLIVFSSSPVGCDFVCVSQLYFSLKAQQVTIFFRGIISRIQVLNHCQLRRQP